MTVFDRLKPLTDHKRSGTVDAQERSGTLDGLKRFQNHVHASNMMETNTPHSILINIAKNDT
jgi:hypothetical protein